MPVYKYEKKNSTYWYVKYNNSTKRGFKTKREAQLYEAKLKLSNNQESNVPIFNIAKDYLELHETQVSYGSYNKTKQIIESHIFPNIKNKYIHEITELDCRDFYMYLSKLNYSTCHKNKILNAYKHIFKHAEKFYHLQKNPSHVLDSFKTTYDEKKKKKENEFNIWNDIEFKQFIANVDKPIYKELFIILYYTGMRLGEALALQWSDFYDGKLNITKSITRKTKKGSYEIKEPKNIFSVRSIELGDTINAFMLEFQDREQKICGYNDKWFIFGRMNPLPQTNIDRTKDKAIKKANLRRIRIHDLRHSHASNLIANNVNIVAVSKRLGHKDINMTLNTYTHLLKKNDDELTQFINKSSQNILNTK